MSIAGLLFSFVPILLYQLGAPEALAWRCSSAALAVHWIVDTVRSRRAFASLPHDDRPQVARGMMAVLAPAWVAILSLLVGNAAGAVYAGESAPVLVALVWMVAMSAYQFAALLRVLQQRTAAG